MKYIPSENAEKITELLNKCKEEYPEMILKKQLKKLWEQACKMMPKQSEWTGKEYVVEQEAEKQLDNSRETQCLCGAFAYILYGLQFVS